MHATPLIGWLLVVVGAATGLSCLLRTTSGCAAAPGERRTARAEGIMGLGMALMAVPAGVVDQHPWGPPLFAVVFGVAALRSLLLVRHGVHHLHHTLSAAAMVYMAVVMATAPLGSGGAMGGMDMGRGPSQVSALTAGLMCYFGAYTLWAGTRMLSATPATATVPVPVLRSPEMVAACRVSMGIGMLAMLMLM